MKRFIGNCVNNPFGTTEKLTEIIDNATHISKTKFRATCDLDDMEIVAMKRFPCDFEFFQNGKLMFYTHSRIEHFFR